MRESGRSQMGLKYTIFETEWSRNPKVDEPNGTLVRAQTGWPLVITLRIVQFG